MATDWPRKTVAELQADGLLLVEDGNHGEYRPRTSEFGDGKWAFIRAADMDNGTVLFESAERINDVAFQRIRKGIGKGGDVLFSHKGTVGKLAIASLDAPPFVCSPQTTFWRTLDEVRLSRRFLYYYMQSRAFTEQWMGRKGETDMADYVSLTAQRELYVSVPPLSEQEKIAAVLGSLDDKIEQNRRTGAKLEGLARAVFKAWFVDFEPVKAKAAGATAFPGMPPETFAALPTRFTNSDLGHVPAGWEVRTIKERAAVIQYGLTTSATTDPAGPQFLRITDIRGGSVDWQTVPYCAASAADCQKYRILDGDIVVARTGASTGDNLYIVQPPKSVFASYLVRFQFDEPAVARIVAEFMRTETYQSFVKGAIGGSAQPNANAQTLAGASLVFPPLEIAQAFYEVVHSFDLKRAADARESAKLAALRDYLLPRLLSGRVRVSIPS